MTTPNNDNPVATEETRPAEVPTLEGSLNGSLLDGIKESYQDLHGAWQDELRQRLDERIASLTGTQSPPIQSGPDLSDLSEIEREQRDAEQSRLRAELEALSVENELLSLGRDYPREVSILHKMLQADTIDGWVETLHEAMGAGPEPEHGVADVDRNNPPGTPMESIARTDPRDLVRLPDGSFITQEEGWRILSQARSLHE